MKIITVVGLLQFLIYPIIFGPLRFHMIERSNQTESFIFIDGCQIPI